jgi:hypothetical protein
MNGHETTTFAIANGMHALLLHPSELARLRDDPGLIAGAVEEVLRYDGSIQMRGVSAREDLELDAKQIRAGQVLWLAIGATGRDPWVFREPTRFDIGPLAEPAPSVRARTPLLHWSRACARGDRVSACRPSRAVRPDRTGCRRGRVAADRRLPRAQGAAPRARPLSQSEPITVISRLRNRESSDSRDADSGRRGSTESDRACRGRPRLRSGSDCVHPNSTQPLARRFPGKDSLQQLNCLFESLID